MVNSLNSGQHEIWGVLLKLIQWVSMAAADQTCTACWTGTLVPQEGGILVCDVCGTQSQVGSCSVHAPSPILCML